MQSDGRKNREIQTAQLATLETQFAAVFHASPIAMAITRQSDGRLVSINDRFLALIDRPRSEVESPGALLHRIWPDSATRTAVLEKLERQRCLENVSAEFAVRAGRRVARIAAAVTECDGEECLLLCGVDVTDQVKSDAESWRQQELFHTVFDHLPVMVTVLDSCGQPVMVNRAWEKVIGWTLADLQGRDLLEELYPNPNSRKCVLEFIQQSAGVWVDFRTRVRDGRVIDTCWANVPLSDGMSIGIGQDITDRKQAEQALLKSQQRFQTFMDHSPAVAFMKDDAGRFVFVNRFMLEHFRWSAESILGKSDEEVFSEPFARQFRVNDRYVLESRQPLSIVELAPEPDGTTSQWLVQKFPFQDETGRMCLGGVGVNLTERARAEEALRHAEEQIRQSQKMEAIGSLAGGIAHDFNNLLTVVLGNVEYALEMFSQDPLLHECLSEVLEAGQRAAALTTQLLAFSRRQMLEPQVLDLNELVTAMHKLLGRLIGEHVRLVTGLASDLHPVRADRSQIEQIVMNLAINARDAMPDGGRLIIETDNVVLDDTETEIRADVIPGPYVLLAVSDNGCGMTPEVKARAFEPFFTTKEKGKGTGMGLATVFGIVKQSGGHITLYSEPGQGTTFKVYLPQVETGGRQPTDQRNRPEAAHGTETVLLVEDEAAVRRLGRRILQEAGYHVLEAGSGMEALASSAGYDRTIHLLVTDVMMPEMSGRQLAEQILQQRPETRVLYVSGYTDEAIVHHGVLDPGTEFLQKPYTAGTLTGKVRRVLDRPRSSSTEPRER